ncbi:MAG: sulfur carrier protein ThiS [Gemmatimonadales bacterium]
MNEVTLIINGDQRRVPALASVQELLEHLGLDARGVVVEVNEHIIRRPHLRETTLNEGDRVELVHFVGGG